MGYHTGSKICVELANLIQERINHLILISAPIYKKNELEEQHKNMGNYTAPKGDGSHLIKAWNGLWKWRGPNQMPTDIMKIFPDQIKGGHKSHWGHKAAFSYTYPERIKNIKSPILVINTKVIIAISKSGTGTLPTCKEKTSLVLGQSTMVDPLPFM